MDVIGLGRKFILRCNRNIGGGSEALFQCYGLIPHASSSIFLHHKFHTIYLVLLFDCSNFLLGISWNYLCSQKMTMGGTAKLCSVILYVTTLHFSSAMLDVTKVPMYEQSCKRFTLTVDKSSTILQILEEKKIHGKTNWNCYPF